MHARLLISSLDTISSVIVSPVVASVLSPLSDVIASVVSVGAVKSILTEPVSALVSAAAIVFPAASAPLSQLNPAVPSRSPSSSVPSRRRVADQEVPEPAALASAPSIVHVRPVMSSDAVIVRVTVSPLFACAVSALFEAMLMVRVGAVSSCSTPEVAPEESVVTWVPALPAASVKSRVKVTSPSASLS